MFGMVGLVALATVIILPAPAGAAKARTKARAGAGYVAAVEGQAYRQGAREDRWVTLAARRTTYVGDRLTTLADSKLLLLLWNQTAFLLGPDSRAEVPAPARDQRDRVVQVSEGSFRLLVPVRTRKTQLLIQTPTAMVSVRSTEVLVEVETEKTAIAVVRGEAEVKGSANGQAVRLQAGQGTDVAAGKDPSPPEAWGKERIKRLREATSLAPGW